MQHALGTRLVRTKKARAFIDESSAAGFAGFRKDDGRRRVVVRNDAFDFRDDLSPFYDDDG